MGGRIEIREESGIRFLFIDLSGLRTQGILDLLPEVNKVAIPEKIRLHLLDITNTYSNAEIRDASKASIAECEAKIGKVYSTLIGISGIQKIIANAINRNQYFAKNYEDAVSYLVKKSELL